MRKEIDFLANPTRREHHVLWMENTKGDRCILGIGGHSLRGRIAVRSRLTGIIVDSLLQGRVIAEEQFTISSLRLGEEYFPNPFSKVTYWHGLDFYNHTKAN